MEQKENIRIEELLPRYCDGNVTMEERHLVEEWMAESEEHQKIVRQMYLINLSADTLSVMNRVQPEKALQKVNRRIRLSEAKLWLHRLNRQQLSYSFHYSVYTGSFHAQQRKKSVG